MVRQLITDTLTNPPERRPLPQAWTTIFAGAIEQIQHHQKPVDTTQLTTSSLAEPQTPVVRRRPTPSQPAAGPVAAQSINPAAYPAVGYPSGGQAPPVFRSYESRPAPAAPPIKRSTLVVLGAALAAGILVFGGIAGYRVLHNNAPASSIFAGALPNFNFAVPKPFPESSIGFLLLTPAALNQVMGTTTLAGQPPTDQMGDHRDLLPNLNCLGVWQIDESAIYGKTYTAVRQQTLRTPDADQWDSLVAQSVVYYDKADVARWVFDESAERWSKCANHHVAITLNDQLLPKWSTGELGRTDIQLAMPITRGVGDQTRWCQHVLRVVTNVVIDVEVCTSQPPPVTQATTIADQIGAKVRLG
jgi:hypothetical protein